MWAPQLRNALLPLALASAATALLAPAAHASDYVTERRITNIGCHHSDGTCFVTLDGAPFGANEGCAQGTSFSQFRFDNADTTNGRRTYASLIAAYLSGRRVTIAINGCSSQGVPTLSYYHVHD